MSGQIKSETVKMKYFSNLDKFLLTNICKYKTFQKDYEKVITEVQNNNKINNNRILII